MYSVTFRPPSAPFHVLVSAQASLRLLHDEVLTWKKEKNRISIRSPYSWYCAIFRQSCLIRKVSLHGFKTWSKRKVALLDIFLSISYRSPSEPQRSDPVNLLSVATFLSILLRGRELHSPWPCTIKKEIAWCVFCVRSLLINTVATWPDSIRVSLSSFACFSFFFFSYEFPL